MDSFPNPPAFDPARMEGQAEHVRANMGNPRHEEQVREAERAKREAERGQVDTLLGRITRWLRRGK